MVNELVLRLLKALMKELLKRLRSYPGKWQLHRTVTVAEMIIKCTIFQLDFLG